MYFLLPVSRSARRRRSGLDSSDEVVEPDEVMPAALALAAKIAKKSPLGLRYAKQALRRPRIDAAGGRYEHEQGFEYRLM